MTATAGMLPMRLPMPLLLLLAPCLDAGPPVQPTDDAAAAHEAILRKGGFQSSTGGGPAKGSAAAPPRLCAGLEDAETTSHCREETVKGAIRHAWTGYVKHGWGSDDFSPQLGKGVENWHARSTIYDSLDTLWLAGMHEEFDAVLRELRWRTTALRVQLGHVPRQTEN